MNKQEQIGQAEQKHYPVYLGKNRDWHPRQLPVKDDHWEHDFHGFSSKVFFLSDGRIGIEHGGRVVVRTIEDWMGEKQA